MLIGQRLERDMTDVDMGQLLTDNVFDGGRLDDSSVPAVQLADGNGNMQGLALGIWVYEAGRDMGEVQRILHDRTGMTVSLSQLRAWRDQGRWGDVSGSIHQALVGQGNEITSQLLEYGQVVALRVFLEIAQDKRVSPNARIRAAANLADRGRLPVMLRGEMVDPIHLSRKSEYDEMSDDELEAEYASFNADAYTDGRQRIADTMNTARVVRDHNHATSTPR
jgi:hypothetical protein